MFRSNFTGRRALIDLQIAGYICHVAADDGREVSINDSGVAATHELDERRDLVADRNLRETQFARERSDASLMVGVAISVHEDDGDRAEAICQSGGKHITDGSELGCFLHHAVGAHALVYLNHALVEHLRLDDVPGEDVGPCLVADLERVAKTLGDQQQCALAFALKERVSRDRGPHLDRADCSLRDGLSRGNAEKIANSLHRRVPIGPRVLRQKLMGDEGVVRPTPDDIGKSAATVDPEIPSPI